MAARPGRRLPGRDRRRKGLFKVRLTRAGPREAVDATALKLKNRGFKPFAMKVE